MISHLLFIAPLFRFLSIEPAMQLKMEGLTHGYIPLGVGFNCFTFKTAH